MLSPQVFDYQSDWHCSKTTTWSSTARPLFDYQSDWHCSKTACRSCPSGARFDYQSDWHCSKTDYPVVWNEFSLITSQIDTAPKRTTQDRQSVTVWLPVRLTLLQNHWNKFPHCGGDGQPDQTSLNAQENAGQQSFFVHNHIRFHRVCSPEAKPSSSNKKRDRKALWPRYSLKKF